MRKRGKDGGDGEGNNSRDWKRNTRACCDVFHLENGKITPFHCDLAAAIILAQLGLT